MKPFDPYKILKLKRTATEEQIKKAYRTLSMKWHPDRNIGVSRAAEEFAKVNLAYHILSDPIRRARYDATGDASEEKPDNTLANDLAALGQAFVASVQQVLGEGRLPSKTDILGRMRTLISQPLEGHRKALRDAQKQKNVFTDCLSRIELVEPGETNFLADMVRRYLASIEEQMKCSEADIAMGERLLKRIAKYRYRYDAGESNSTGTIYHHLVTGSW